MIAATYMLMDDVRVIVVLFFVIGSLLGLFAKVVIDEMWLKEKATTPPGEGDPTGIPSMVNSPPPPPIKPRRQIPAVASKLPAPPPPPIRRREWLTAQVEALTSEYRILTRYERQQQDTGRYLAGRIKQLRAELRMREASINSQV